MTQGPTVAETEAMRDYMLAALHAMTEIVRASPVVPTSVNIAPGALNGAAAPYSLELAYRHRRRDVLIFAEEHGLQVHEYPSMLALESEAQVVQAQGILYGHAVRAYWRG